MRRRRVRRRRGARDAALLALAFTCGLTVSELIALDVQDYDAETGLLSVPGRDEEVKRLPLVGTTQEIVELWLSYHGGDSSRMFFPISKFGIVYAEQISQSGLSDIIHLRAAGGRARWTPKSQTPSFRALRRSFEEHLAVKGSVRPAVVRDLMGKASRRRVSRNADREDAAMREALVWMATTAASGVRVPPRRRPSL